MQHPKKRNTFPIPKLLIIISEKSETKIVNIQLITTTKAKFYITSAAYMNEIGPKDILKPII